MSNLFIAVMWNNMDDYSKVIKTLEQKFGKILKQSEEYDFDAYTNHYEPEMGKGIKKKFLVFEKNIEKHDLVAIKKETTEIEQEFIEGEDKRKYTEVLIEGKRKINIDPGYINDKELVLASFKRKRFKEDLGEGVFAHKVLEFEDGKIVCFFHTFKDYEHNVEFFRGLITFI